MFIIEGYVSCHILIQWVPVIEKDEILGFFITVNKTRATGEDVSRVSVGSEQETRGL